MRPGKGICAALPFQRERGEILNRGNRRDVMRQRVLLPRMRQRVLLPRMRFRRRTLPLGHEPEPDQAKQRDRKRDQGKG